MKRLPTLPGQPTDRIYNGPVLVLSADDKKKNVTVQEFTHYMEVCDRDPSVKL